MKAGWEANADAARRRVPTVGQEAVSPRSRMRRPVRSQWLTPRHGSALASLGVFASLWVANPRKGRLWLKTESCLAGEAQTRTTRPNGNSPTRSGRSETAFFRGYSKNRDKRAFAKRGALGKMHKLRSAGLSRGLRLPSEASFFGAFPLRRMTFASRQPFASR